MKAPILFLLIFLLAACQLDAPPLPLGNSTPVDTPFTLRSGQSIAVAGQPATLRLERWADDRRCPTGETCAESGPVKIQITLARAGHTPAYPVFTVHTDHTGAVLAAAPGSEPMVQIGPFRITLTAVTPYPAAGQAIAWEGYRATFVVSLDPAARPDTDAGLSISSDAPFVLAPGEQVTLTGRPVALRVDSVAALPCPPGASCVTGSAIDVGLSWLEEGAAAQSVHLRGVTDKDGVVGSSSAPLRALELVDGAALRLVRVLPAPDTSTEQGDFRVTLSVADAPRMSNGSTFVAPGEAFALGSGYTAVIGADLLRLRLDAIIEDSRCPRGVEFVQAGQVLAAITVASTEQRATTYVLGGQTDEEGLLASPPLITHDLFTVTLLQVAPYPEEPGAALPADAYVATFVVDAPAGSVPTPFPSATATPLPDTALLPLLCTNDFALLRLNAGGADEPVTRLTAPLPQSAATDYGAAHALCNKTFGAEWTPAGPTTVAEFAAYLPTGQPLWLWDGMASRLVRYQP